MSSARLKLLKKRSVLILLVIVVIASAGMTAMHYYTIRILSAARAYINGESQYSKGQKDASARLINYIYLENEADFTGFEQDIGVPIGDRQARIALSSNINYRDAIKGFLQGKNHPDDVSDLIWLFGTFKHLPMFEKAIKIWASGDSLVNNLQNLGLQVREKIISGKIQAAEKRSMILAISNISADLTIKEQAFSNTMGAISRTINLYVFIADLFITLVIVIGSLSFAWIMIRNLAESKMKIIEQNDSLQLINAGLDKFVVNVTHDLRSPLIGLIGLIGLITEEDDMGQIKSYTLMMKDSLEKQDQFIVEMLAFLKSKHLGVVKKECSLATIIDNVITLNQYRHSGKEIQFYKEVGVNNIRCDALKLQVILNNLVSNSIKYSDAKKDEQWGKGKNLQIESRDGN